MKKISFGLSVFLSMAPFFTFAAVHTVKMKSISFEPRKISIVAGESVDWQNVAYTDHSATSEEKEIFDTGLIAPQKKSKPVVFSKPGNYFYNCSIHGKTMRAQIDVVAAVVPEPKQ